MNEKIKQVAEAISAAGDEWIKSHIGTGWADIPDTVFAVAAIMNNRGKALSVRMALIEAVRYGRRVVMANADGVFRCSLGPDGDLMLTPIEKTGAEITMVWIDECPQ